MPPSDLPVPFSLRHDTNRGTLPNGVRSTLKPNVPRASTRRSTSAHPDVGTVRLGIDWWGSGGIGPPDS